MRQVGLQKACTYTAIWLPSLWKAVFVRGYAMHLRESERNLHAVKTTRDFLIETPCLAAERDRFSPPGSTAHIGLSGAADLADTTIGGKREFSTFLTSLPGCFILSRPFLSLRCSIRCADVHLTTLSSFGSQSLHYNGHTGLVSCQKGWAKDRGVQTAYGYCTP